VGILSVLCVKVRAVYSERIREGRLERKKFTTHISDYPLNHYG
jgi:hypothetical protein